MKSISQISVIIPIYNAAPYLKECLNSLMKQTFLNFEVICINDGSTDDSEDILQYYASTYKNIFYFNQSNQKTGMARKHAIEKAVGEYIVYLDADDYVDSCYLKHLYEHLIKTHSDIVYCGYWVVNDIKIRSKKCKIKPLKNPKTKEKIFYKTGAAKIVKKSLFEKIIFPIECAYGEDSCISMQLALQHPKVSILKECLYYERQNNQSVRHQKNFSAKLRQLLNAYIAMETFLLISGIYNDYIELIRNQFQKSITQLIENEAA